MYNCSPPPPPLEKVLIRPWAPPRKLNTVFELAAELMNIRPPLRKSLDPPLVLPCKLNTVFELAW